MLVNDVRAAFDTRLKSAIDDVVNYPVLNCTPWAAENTPNKVDDSWIRSQLEILNSENGRIGIDYTVEGQLNEGYTKHEGFYAVAIFTKINTGTKASNDIQSELTTLFQNRTFSGVWCRVPQVRKIGDDQFGFYHVNFLVPFTTVS